VKRISIFLITVTLIAGMVGCGGGGGEYDLTIASTAGGSVTTPGEGTFTYDEGTDVDLVAVADEDYLFDEWIGDVATIADDKNPTTTITMNGDYTITANFKEIGDGDGGITIPFKNPGSFVQMTIEDPQSLDPAWVYDSASCEQLGYIYETLLFYEGEEVDQFVPVLATEWEFDSESVSYRFKIREGVKFHEGGDLTPSDVEYSFERAMVQDRSNGPVWMLYTPLLGSLGDPYWGCSRDGNGNIHVTFEQIDNAVEVDGDWVVFHLNDPAWSLAFLQILCGPWVSIVDKEWCVANGNWDGTEETWQDYNNPNKGDSYLYDHTNGTGPWKLKEWDPGVQIKLVRNDDYWREPAAFETVITQVVEEWTTRKLALLAGDADLIYVPWPPTDIGELEGIADLNVYQDLPELYIDGFFFTMDIASDSSFIGSGALDGEGIPTDFFSDIDVRKGFNYAFDWETYISDACMGEAEQRGSPIIEGLPFYNPDASMYSPDLAKAEEHLQAAWDGEVWEKGFKFTLLYNACNLRRKISCEILAENLVAISPKFQVNLLPMDCGTGILPYFEARLLPMFQVGWLPDYPHPNDYVVPFMSSYDTFHRWQGYGYPELDELIEGAFKELDPAVQEDLYYEIQERYYEDAPSIMLCQPLGRRYFTKYIQGFYFNPFFAGYAVPLYHMSKSES